MDAGGIGTTRFLEVVMAWFVLILAGLMETGWAVGLKLAVTRPSWWLYCVIGVLMVGSIAALSYAMRGLPLGVAYPLWTGIGAVGAVICGVVLFRQEIGILTISGVILLIAGMVLIGLETK